MSGLTGIALGQASPTSGETEQILRDWDVTGQTGKKQGGPEQLHNRNVVRLAGGFLLVRTTFRKSADLRLGQAASDAWATSPYHKKASRRTTVDQSQARTAPRGLCLLTPLIMFDHGRGILPCSYDIMASGYVEAESGIRGTDLSTHWYGSLMWFPRCKTIC